MIKRSILVFLFQMGVVLPLASSETLTITKELLSSEGYTVEYNKNQWLLKDQNGDKVGSARKTQSEKKCFTLSLFELSGGQLGSIETNCENLGIETHQIDRLKRSYHLKDQEGAIIATARQGDKAKRELFIEDPDTREIFIRAWVENKEQSSASEWCFFSSQKTSSLVEKLSLVLLSDLVRDKILQNEKKLFLKRVKMGFMVTGVAALSVSLIYLIWKDFSSHAEIDRLRSEQINVRNTLSQLHKDCDTQRAKISFDQKKMLDQATLDQDALSSLQGKVDLLSTQSQIYNPAAIPDELEVRDKESVDDWEKEFSYESLRLSSND